jgi:hypothetical protein
VFSFNVQGRKFKGLRCLGQSGRVL